jgi:hypothetical protein
VTNRTGSLGLAARLTAALAVAVLAACARFGTRSDGAQAAATFPATHLFADLDGDGKPDAIALDQTTASVTLRVQFADRAHRPQRFTFAVDAGREDAICRVPVRLQLESLNYDLAAAVGEPVPGFVRSGRATGFRLADGVCDAIHFFWNHRTNRLQWWRL